MNLKNKKINMSLFKKTILLLLIFVMLVPSIFLYKPQKAEALFGAGSDEANIAVWIKEYMLDPIAYAFMNVMVSQMSSQAINWINGSNFTGPGGGKTLGFIEQPGVFLQNVADAALGEYIRSVEPFLCSPFKVDVRLSLNTKYKGGIQNTNYCTLTEVGENVENAYNNFINNFNNGGWERWVRLTTNPGNNRYGSVVKADAEAMLKIGDEKFFVADDLARGFLDQKVEAGECSDFAKISLYDKNGDPFPDIGLPIKGHWVNPYTDEDLGLPYGSPPCIGTDTRTTKTVTPGSFLQTQLSEAIGDSKGRLRVADEIDEIVGALISKLVMTGFDALGLRGTNTSGEEGDISNSKRQIRTMIDRMTAKTKEYISIKKTSLEKIGSFGTDGVDITQDTPVIQKINWAGNDFEWSTGKYYKENRATKTDWTGEFFSWRNNIHYGEKNTATGVIQEVGCATLEDSLRTSASYITNDSTLSPFWYRSRCLDKKDTAGNHIKYEWEEQPTLSTGSKENSIVKSMDAYCNKDSLGTTGYIIVSESDGFWSSSKCQSAGVNNYDWLGITKVEPTKNIRTQKTTRYIERKVDTNGLLFNWDVGYALSGRGWYSEPDEMRNIIKRPKMPGAVYGSNAPIEISTLATAPKVCFPTSETRDTIQTIQGVMKGQNAGYEKWTILECTRTPGDPVSETALANFYNKFPDEDMRGYGMWKKLSNTPPAKIRIVLEGDNFDNLKSHYGDAEISKMFYDLLACFTTKYGTSSTETNGINTKISERKSHRLQIISDILLAEKMIENVSFLESTFNSLGANGAFDYTNFLEQLYEIEKVIGISDAQITEANAEKAQIETENTYIKMRLNMCEKGDTYLGTEEDYWFGYNEMEQSGYDKGYEDGRGGINNEPPYGDRLPSGEPTRIGYENGKKDGYYFGYVHGHEIGEQDIRDRN